MIYPSVAPDSSVNWRRLGSLSVILTILMALVALPSPPVIPTRVHATLLKLALSQPAAPVDVIVQRATPSADLAPLVGRLGGTIIRELKLINAAVVNLPAQAVVELGRAAEVRWISLDAPMVDHGCYPPSCTDTSEATGDWIEAIKLRDLWRSRPDLQGQGVNVAVIDSGIDPEHYDFAGRIVRNVAVHRNLVLNGGFGDGLSSWEAADGGVTTAQATAGGYDPFFTGNGGELSALFLPAVAATGAPVSLVQRLNSFIPGTTYTLSAAGRVDHVQSGCFTDSDNWVGVRGVVDGQIWGTGLKFCNNEYEEQQISFVVPEDTEYVELVAVQNSPLQGAFIDAIRVTPAQIDQDGGPVLIGVASTPPAVKDLSAEGGIDWYHRGLNASTSAVNRRQGTARITLKNMGLFTPTAFKGSGTSYTWSNGTPTASVAGTSEGIAAAGFGSGFEVRVPATTALRTLRVYLTIQNAQLDVYGFLSDGSVLPFTDASVDTVGRTDGLRRVMYTFTYRASDDLRNLRVRFTNNYSMQSNARVIFHGATLAEGSSVPIATSHTTLDSGDQYGHGTLMAGLIAGDGLDSDGSIIGVAPEAGLVNVRVMDANGEATVSDVIRGLEWIYQNRERYNIRVVNMSLNSNVAESHLTSPLSAAVEILWINRIVVVVSAGNNGADGVLYPPANDPLVITVGSVDHDPTRNPVDVPAGFSAVGLTDKDYAPKPEIVAPGVNIIGAGCASCLLNQTYTQNVPWEMSNAQQYFRASGTSLSAALVSGAAALVLQANPNLDPDQVKYRLMSTGGAQFGPLALRYLNVYAAVNGTSTESANQNRTVSSLLYTGDEAIANGSAKWGSAKWGSAKWGSAKWGSAKWGSTTTAASLRGSVRGMSLMPPGPASGRWRP